MHKGLQNGVKLIFSKFNIQLELVFIHLYQVNSKILCTAVKCSQMLVKHRHCDENL